MLNLLKREFSRMLGSAQNPTTSSNQLLQNDEPLPQRLQKEFKNKHYSMNIGSLLMLVNSNDSDLLVSYLSSHLSPSSISNIVSENSLDKNPESYIGLFNLTIHILSRITNKIPSNINLNLSPSSSPSLGNFNSSTITMKGINNSGCHTVILRGDSGSGKSTVSQTLIDYFVLKLGHINKQINLSLHQNNNNNNVINADDINNDENNAVLADCIKHSFSLMKSFCNSKTSQHDNSSRCATYFRINYNQKSQISSVGMEILFFEKSRLVNLMNGDRNFHIFYQMICGLNMIDSGLCSKLKLKDINDFKILVPFIAPPPSSSSSSPIINSPKRMQSKKTNVQTSPLMSAGRNSKKDFFKNDNHTDESSFESMLRALIMINFQGDEYLELWEILSAILHLGNITWISGENENDICSIKSESSESMTMKEISEMLGVSEFVLMLSLTTIQFGKNRKSVHKKALPIEGCIYNLTSLIKYLYQKLTTYLINRLNNFLDELISEQLLSNSLKQNQKGNKYNSSIVSDYYIAILDIFGFENLAINSLEQLNINYTNEHMQLIMFEYFDNNISYEFSQDELIIPSNVSFKLPLTNQPVIDLINKKPNGLYPILEELNLLNRKPDDLALINSFNKIHDRNSSVYSKYRIGNDSFIIKHFCGDIKYNCQGFIYKNNDTLQTSLIDLLEGTSNILLQKSLEPFQFTSRSHNSYFQNSTSNQNQNFPENNNLPENNNFSPNSSRNLSLNFENNVQNNNIQNGNSKKVSIAKLSLGLLKGSNKSSENKSESPRLRLWGDGDKNSIKNRNNKNENLSNSNNSNTTPREKKSFFSLKSARKNNYNNENSDFEINSNNSNSTKINNENNLQKNQEKNNISINKSNKTGNSNNNTITTVTSILRNDLNNVLQIMKESELHFILCVKPNENNYQNNTLPQQEIFNIDYVNRQLLNYGALDLFKVSKIILESLKYDNVITIREFFEQYKLMLSTCLSEDEYYRAISCNNLNFIEIKSFVEMLLSTKLKKDSYHIGFNNIYLRGNYNEMMKIVKDSDYENNFENNSNSNSKKRDDSKSFEKIITFGSKDNNSKDFNENNFENEKNKHLTNVFKEIFHEIETSQNNSENHLNNNLNNNFEEEIPIPDPMKPYLEDEGKVRVDDSILEINNLELSNLEMENEYIYNEEKEEELLSFQQSCHDNLIKAIKRSTTTGNNININDLKKINVVRKCLLRYWGKKRNIKLKQRVEMLHEKCSQGYSWYLFDELNKFPDDIYLTQKTKLFGFSFLHHTAIRYNQVDVLKILKLKPSTVMESNVLDSGKNLIHYAIVNNSKLEVIQFLADIVGMTFSDRQTIPSNPYNIKLKSGWLRKQSQKDKTWRFKWITLTDTGIQYSSAPKGVDFIDFYPLDRTHASFCRSGTKNYFQITITLIGRTSSIKQNSTLSLKASSEDELEEWVKYLSVSTQNEGFRKSDPYSVVNLELRALALSKVNLENNNCLHLLASGSNKTGLMDNENYKKNQVKVAMWLIENGCPLNGKNNKKKTVLDLAIEKGHSELIACIKEQITYLYAKSKSDEEHSLRMSLINSGKNNNNNNIEIISSPQNHGSHTSFPYIPNPLRRFGYTYISLFFENLVYQPPNNSFIQQQNPFSFSRKSCPFLSIAVYNAFHEIIEPIQYIPCPSLLDSKDIWWGKYWRMFTPIENIPPACTIVIRYKEIEKTNDKTKKKQLIDVGWAFIRIEKETINCYDLYLDLFAGEFDVSLFSWGIADSSGMKLKSTMTLFKRTERKISPHNFQSTIEGHYSKTADDLRDMNITLNPLRNSLTLTSSCRGKVRKSIVSNKRRSMSEYNTTKDSLASLLNESEDDNNYNKNKNDERHLDSNLENNQTSRNSLFSTPFKANSLPSARPKSFALENSPIRDSLFNSSPNSSSPNRRKSFFEKININNNIQNNDINNSDTDNNENVKNNNHTPAVKRSSFVNFDFNQDDIRESEFYSRASLTQSTFNPDLRESLFRKRRSSITSTPIAQEQGRESLFRRPSIVNLNDNSLLDNSLDNNENLINYASVSAKNLHNFKLDLSKTGNNSNSSNQNNNNSNNNNNLEDSRSSTGSSSRLSSARSSNPQPRTKLIFSNNNNSHSNRNSRNLRNSRKSQRSQSFVRGNERNSERGSERGGEEMSRQLALSAPKINPLLITPSSPRTRSGRFSQKQINNYNGNTDRNSFRNSEKSSLRVSLNDISSLNNNKNFDNNIYNSMVGFKLPVVVEGLTPKKLSDSPSTPVVNNLSNNLSNNSEIPNEESLSSKLKKKMSLRIDTLLTEEYASPRLEKKDDKNDKDNIDSLSNLGSLGKLISNTKVYSNLSNTGTSNNLNNKYEEVDKESNMSGLGWKERERNDFKNSKK